MTRAVKLILQGKMIDSFYYNIMALPLVMVISVSMVFFCIDMLKHQTNYLDKIEGFFQKHTLLIFAVILVVWLFNIILNGERL